jgi:hypothetical protein
MPGSATPTMHPYFRRRFLYSCALIEFDCFLRAAPAIVEEELGHISRALPLRNVHGFIVQSFNKFTLQIWFGARPTNREILASDTTPARYATEIGAMLLYSIGPRGETAVVLYPAKSEVMKAKEDFIIRAFGNMTCYQLRQRIRRDLKDLVAYTYATALDGSPTLGERARVWWIRLVCRMQVEGKQSIRTTHYLHQGVGFLARSGVIAMLKPLGILVLILILLSLGYSSLVEFLRKGISLQ